jgi:excisionase family DNA binding protein
MEDAETMLTPAEAAVQFRVHVRTLTRWADAGKIHTIRTLGGVRRYFQSEVSALLRGEAWELPPKYARPERCFSSPGRTVAKLSSRLGEGRRCCRTAGEGLGSGTGDVLSS